MTTPDPHAPTRATTHAPDPLVGAEVGGYRLEERIGAGGMGTVYRATQLSLGRAAAVKLLPEASSDDGHYLERFHREADALSRLSHPNIVTVFDRGTHAGRPWLAMEYVEGTNLRTVMRSAPIPPAEALTIVRSVLSALEHAHDRGIVHRDVKPENVLLAPGGIVKVADFGLSRVLQPDLGTRLTRSHMLLGTYEYMAPEQREHAREADARSDLYATGVVLYELLAGELPIGAFAPLTRKCDYTHAGTLDAIVRRALDKDPGERWQRAGEMADEISAVLDSEARAGVRTLPSVAAATRTLHFDPLRFATRLDLLATMSVVLGTIFALGGAVWFLLGAIDPDSAWYGPGPDYTIAYAVPAIGWAMLSMFAFQTATGLRRFRPGARQANGILAFLAAPWGLTTVYSILSWIWLQAFRPRHYFDARARGLSAEDAITSIHEAALGQVPEDEPAAARAQGRSWWPLIWSIVVGCALAALWGAAFEVLHEGRVQTGPELFLAWFAMGASLWTVVVQPRLFRAGRHGPYWAFGAFLVFAAVCVVLLVRLDGVFRAEYSSW